MSTKQTDIEQEKLPLANRQEVIDFSPEREFDSITNRVVTPENIDGYAKIALDDLIKVVGKTIRRYNSMPTIKQATGVEEEREALRFSNLDPFLVEETLDHISAVAEEIDGLDDVIARRDQKVDRIIVPPDSNDTEILEGGENKFDEKRTIPRLKTLLLVLQNEFEIDLENSDEIQITHGDITESMMRRASYRVVELPTLDRAVFICDEENNATFVFNTLDLDENGISVDDMSGLGKQGIKEILEYLPKAGRRLVYSKSFVAELTGAIEEPANIKVNRFSRDVIDEMDIGAGQYLQPSRRTPEGHLTAKEIVDILGGRRVVSVWAVRNVAQELGLEPIKMKSLTGGQQGQQTYYYSPDEQAKIIESLRQSGTLGKQVPEGYLSFEEIVNSLGGRRVVSIDTVRNLAKGLGLEPIKVKPLAGGQRQGFYSPDEQAKIIESLRQSGTLGEQVPEGYMPIEEIVDRLGGRRVVSPETVRHTSTDLGIEPIKFKPLGGVQQKYYYSPDEQAKIIESLRQNGALGEQLPEGYLSREEIMDSLGGSRVVSLEHITVVAKALGFEPMKMKPLGRAKPLGFYSQDEQVKIIESLRQRGTLGEQVPDGYLSIDDIVDKLGGSHVVSRSYVWHKAKELGLEPKLLKRLEGGRRQGIYSPNEQTKIIESLRQNGSLGEQVPEGYLSVQGIVDSLLGRRVISIDAVRNVANELGFEPIKIKPLGRGRREHFYSTGQQDAIRNNILGSKIN